MKLENNNALHTSQVKVRFYDTDLSSFVFFTNHQKWFDSIALVEFLSERGINWNELNKEGLEITLVNISFNYKSPITVDDVVDISIEKVKVRNKSFQLCGSIYKHNTKELVASGKAVYVLIDTKTHQAIHIPDDLRKKIL